MQSYILSKCTPQFLLTIISSTLSNLILHKILNYYPMLKHFSRSAKQLFNPKASVSPRLLMANVYSFAETSRDIELKMRLQRLKGVQDKFKALHTSFGLHRPKTISSDYPKPETIEYTIQSLRKYSHMYPEYLLKELNNKNSQFYEAMDRAVVGFQAVDNKEAIEFLQFLVHWRVYLHNQTFEDVLVRKIYQMEMNLHELFKVLRLVVHVDKEDVRKKIMAILQQKILVKILEIDVSEYQALFKMLNFMRVQDLSPSIKAEAVEQLNKVQAKRREEGEEEEAPITQDSFFKVVEGVLLRDLDNIPLSNLVEMVVHYANNIKEKHDDVINIFGKVEAKIIQNIKFFNHDELIAIMFSYVKTGTESPQLVEEFVKRVELLYFQITWQNKKRILSLASSLPHNKWLYVVGLSIFEVLKGKKVVYRQGQKEVDPNAKEAEFQLLPTIYLAAYETNLATPELIDKIQPKILQQLFNYSAEDIGLIAWLFTITPPSLQPSRDNKNVLYVKLQSIIQGGFNGSTFTLKDVAMVVWSLCNTGGKSNAIYKQNADFWRNIEFYIQERIGNRKQERMFNSCCQILWAYGNNKPLTIKTINMIIDLIVDKNSKHQLDQQMFVFQLTTISSFFHSIKDSLPKSITLYFEKLTVKYFEQLIQSMTYLEIMKMLKYTIYDENNKLAQNKISDDLWQRIIQQFQIGLNTIDYASIMGVVGFMIVSPQGQKAQPKIVQLVKKLMARKASLQQLKKGVQAQ